MASPLNSDDPSQERSPSDRLPFEPRRSSKKAKREEAPAADPKAKSSGTKRADAKAARVQAAKEKLAKMQTRSAEPRGDRRRGKSGIPEVVSRRMLKRMALLSGIPMALAIATFFISYYIVSQDLFPLPTIAVLFVSLGFFGLSVLGLSYGVLSASWEESEEGGSLLGWDEFRLNFDRLLSSWKTSRQAKP